MDQSCDEILVDKHVLIVDDEEQNLYLLEAMLKNEKCVVVRAENGLEALECLKKDTFHLIISDILMPKMDGFQLCRKCKSEARLRDIPFVFCTATYTDKKDEEFALSLGVDRFIKKPVDPEEFIPVIREVLHEYEKGIVPSKRPIPGNEVPYLVEYNERIVRKLEDKVVELDEAYALLAQSEQRYRSIFENAVEGIFQTTLEGKFIRLNPAYARILGYDSPEEMMGHIQDIGKQVSVDPEDRVKYKQILEERGQVQAFEIQLYKKDGGICWVSINARAVKDEAGNTLRYEGIIEDITSRKLAEEELKNTLEKLRKVLAGTIQAMSLTVEARDPYTSGHQRRVASLARAIAQEMGLSKDVIDGIRLAGVVHDIGKISVPAEILAKPTKLLDMEYRLIKVHPVAGYDILKEIDFPWPIAQVVLQHHEKLDGSGYPQGLKDGQILIEAKIITVADVVEAMASHRPYRPALGVDAALEEIEKNKGILYDTGVVEACLKLFKEKRFRLE